MNQTSEVLRAEAKRLRTLADRLDAFASELSGTQPVVASPVNSHITGAPSAPPPGGEFFGMTQQGAITRAIEKYGPQTTRQLYDRLNAGGMAFKKPTYVTAVTGRMENLERTEDGKRLKIKNLPHA